MRPHLTTPDIINTYLDAGYWTRETMVDRFRAHAQACPDRIACSDGENAYSWAELDKIADGLAANLIDLGLPRDATALIQMPSSCREVLLRVALKKAGIIGIFTPLQWRRRELAYVWERIDPSLAVLSSDALDADVNLWLDEAITGAISSFGGPRHHIDMAANPTDGWTGWQSLLDRPPAKDAHKLIAERQFRFDEISLVTASSGTSGLAKLCEWPEGAQVFMSRVGTGAADMDFARTFEERTGCRVIIASGSMECTGFGHAHIDEPKEIRLDGSVGLPLEGCRLQIEDEQGNILPAGTSGELKVTAPFSSSGYWNDPETTAAAWSNGWYATGDIGVLDDDGRLTLLGRLKDTINRSGHKILPAEVEQEIASHADVMECAVIAAPDREYGQVPWAFLEMRPGRTFDADTLTALMKNSGLASYKIPIRFIEVTQFPRISENKIDKKALLAGETAP